MDPKKAIVTKITETIVVYFNISIFREAIRIVIMNYLRFREMLRVDRDFVHWHGWWSVQSLIHSIWVKNPCPCELRIFSDTFELYSHKEVWNIRMLDRDISDPLLRATYSYSDIWLSQHWSYRISNCHFFVYNRSRTHSKNPLVTTRSRGFLASSMPSGFSLEGREVCGMKWSGKT